MLANRFCQLYFCDYPTFCNLPTFYIAFLLLLMYNLN
nr:MAG TPA: hypothetical protein [Caudoviricetes sp.]